MAASIAANVLSTGTVPISNVTARCICCPNWSNKACRSAVSVPAICACAAGEAAVGAGGCGAAGGVAAGGTTAWPAGAEDRAGVSCPVLARRRASLRSACKSDANVSSLSGGRLCGATRAGAFQFGAADCGAFPAGVLGVHVLDDGV